MNLLFWNLAKNSNEPYIFDIMRENDIDVAIFSEYHGINLQLLQHMFQGEYINYNGMGGCDKITLFAKSSYEIKISESSRYVIYTIKIFDITYNIVGIHLPANPHSNAEGRKLVIRDIVSAIVDIEEESHNKNTIVIGDFNASPFDSELVQKDAFNAVLFKDLIMKQEDIEYYGKWYRRFYNPMLHYISENSSCYGSFYYSSGIDTLYWFCYDQVLVRKQLVEQLKNVEYCKIINGKSLMKEVAPNKAISDHLPLIVQFEGGICNES